MLGSEFHATDDEPGAVAPCELSVAYFEVVRASEALRRCIPLCPGALAFLAAAGCHPDMVKTT